MQILFFKNQLLFLLLHKNINIEKYFFYILINLLINKIHNHNISSLYTFHCIVMKTLTRLCLVKHFKPKLSWNYIITKCLINCKWTVYSIIQMVKLFWNFSLLILVFLLFFEFYYVFKKNQIYWYYKDIINYKHYKFSIPADPKVGN